METAACASTLQSLWRSSPVTSGRRAEPTSLPRLPSSFALVSVAVAVLPAAGSGLHFRAEARGVKTTDAVSRRREGCDGE